MVISRRLWGGDEDKREVESKLRSDIDQIVGGLHKRKIKVREGLEASFVDREIEARYILEGVARIRHLNSIAVLYGPKGCGKTELFKALVESINNANERVMGETLFDILMVTYEDGEKVGEGAADKPYIVGSRRLVENLGKTLKKLGVKSISMSINISLIPSISIGMSMGPLGAADTLISVLHKMIEERKLKRNGRLLIVIDEARASGKEEAGRFRNWLEAFANKAEDINDFYTKALNGRISFIVLTSDATVTNIRSAVGIKVDWLFMWNLPRDAFENLAKQLIKDKDDKNKDIKYDIDLLWNLTGGNSRALRNIAETDLDTWLEREIIGGVKSAIYRYYKEHSDNPDRVWSHIVNAAKEPLGFVGNPLERAFLESNIVITGYGGAKIISEMPRMPTIGRANAYQIPAYYYALRAAAKREASILPKIKEVEIPPDEVIEEARKINA